MARAVFEAIGSYAYLISLMYIPLAIALGINMAVPLVVLPFAVLLLGEQVGWRRWSALAVGFAGVLLMVQPGPDGVDWWAMLALASTVVACAARRHDPAHPGRDTVDPRHRLLRRRPDGLRRRDYGPSGMAGDGSRAACAASPPPR